MALGTNQHRVLLGGALSSGALPYTAVTKLWAASIMKLSELWTAAQTMCTAPVPVQLKQCTQPSHRLVESYSMPPPFMISGCMVPQQA